MTRRETNRKRLLTENPIDAVDDEFELQLLGKKIHGLLHARPVFTVVIAPHQPALVEHLVEREEIHVYGFTLVRAVHIYGVGLDPVVAEHLRGLQAGDRKRHNHIVVAGEFRVLGERVEHRRVAVERAQRYAARLVVEAPRVELGRPEPGVDAHERCEVDTARLAAPGDAVGGSAFPRADFHDDDLRLVLKHVEHLIKRRVKTFVYPAGEIDRVVADIEPVKKRSLAAGGERDAGRRDPWPRSERLWYSWLGKIG